MCVNQKFITTRQGKKLLVKCGHCSACKQEKANKRSQRIRNHAKPGTMTLFCTLTFDNHSIPYFSLKDLKKASVYVPEARNYVVDDVVNGISVSSCHCEPVESPLVDGQQYKCVPVYRNCRLNHAGNRCHEKVELDKVYLPYPLCDNTEFKTLRNGSKDRVSVCYYPDFQGFMKRLRQILNRNYKDELHLRGFYVCSEYGPTTCRAHFHPLIFTDDPAEKFEKWQSAICEAWPFAHSSRTKKFVEIAINAASYVSSYVNSSSFVPKIFEDVRTISPVHHYSQGFGLALQHLSLQSLFEAYRKRDLHYDCFVFRDGAMCLERRLFPKYVINRYFPKFKGFSRLTTDEIESVCARPFYIHRYAKWLDYSPEDAYKVEVFLTHKRDYALSCGLSLEDYSRAYAEVYTIYFSNMYADMFRDIQCEYDYLTLYSNIYELYTQSCYNESLEAIVDTLPPDFHVEVDPNKFPLNIVFHSQLVDQYNRLDKSKKVKNKIYSDLNIIF